MKIKISTDSTSDIPIKLQQELNITVLPISIFTEDEREYKDGVDITPKEFYPLIENCEKLPVTSAIPPTTYIDYYETAMSEGYTDIIHVALNSKGSCTFQNAQLARNMFFEEHPDASVNIHIIDSKNYSEGYGMAVIQAARMAKKGECAEAIIEYIEDWMSHVRVAVLPFNLKYIRKSGRLSSAAAFVGDTLGLKPVISFENGEPVVLSKTRGEHNAIKKLVKTVKQERKPGSRFALAYVNDSEAYRIFKELIIAELGEEPEFEYEAGCIIMINTGPAIGVIYYQDK